MPKSKKYVTTLILKELERHGNKSRACRAAGISRQTLARWAKNDYSLGIQVRRAVEVGRA